MKRLLHRAASAESLRHRAGLGAFVLCAMLTACAVAPTPVPDAVPPSAPAPPEAAGEGRAAKPAPRAPRPAATRTPPDKEKDSTPPEREAPPSERAPADERRGAVRDPEGDLSDFGEEGMASWYGARFHSRRTASGERFDMNDFTAAHRTLPFGTRVCVRSLVTGRSVQVRINDRGPHSPGRIVDLSRAAAQSLGLLGLGIKPVVLSPAPSDPDEPCPGS